MKHTTKLKDPKLHCLPDHRSKAVKCSSLARLLPHSCSDEVALALHCSVDDAGLPGAAYSAVHHAVYAGETTAASQHLQRIRWPVVYTLNYAALVAALYKARLIQRVNTMQLITIMVVSCPATPPVETCFYKRVIFCIS